MLMRVLFFFKQYCQLSACSCPSRWWWLGCLCPQYCVVRCCCCVKLSLMFLVLCLRFVFVEYSTLGTDGLDNWGTWWFGCVIDFVCRVLLLVYSGTLKLAGAPVVVLSVVAIDVFSFNARSFIWISWRISLDLLLLPKFVIALEQSTIAAINLSACIMVVQVIFLWLKCIVSVKISFWVDFMWHICVR